MRKSPPPLRVLIADDDPVGARYLVDAVTQAGHACELARDGIDALSLARRQAFDLLLLDLRMPRLDGAGMLAALRGDASAASRNARAVALSGEVEPAQRRALVAAGFEAVLRKPLALADLDHLLAGERADVSEAAALDPAAVLDDAAAVLALGSPDVLRGLRELFRAEIPAQLAALRAARAARDGRSFDEIAHKLAGSSRLCGAGALAAALARCSGVDDADGSDAIGHELERVLAALLNR